MNRRTHQRGSRAAPVARWAASTLLALQLGGLAHMAVVRHTECSDGLLTHGNNPDDRVVSPAPGSPQAALRGESGPGSLESGHDHCGIPDHLKAVRLIPEPSTAWLRVELTGALALERERWGVTRDVLSCAPKQSPPA